MKRGNLFLAGLAVLVFSFILFGSFIPSQADDGSDTLTFTDLNQQVSYHYDQDVNGSGFKGWFDLTATNNTNSAWGDYHFILFDFGSYNSSVIFVDASGGGYDPTSTTTTIDSWTISSDGKSLDLFFYGDALAIGDTINLRVWTDNTAGTNDPFAIGSYPSVVPEPVSSTLFLVGAASLGARRFWKKRKAA